MNSINLHPYHRNTVAAQKRDLLFKISASVLMLSIAFFTNDRVYFFQIGVAAMIQRSHFKNTLQTEAKAWIKIASLDLLSWCFMPLFIHAIILPIFLMNMLIYRLSSYVLYRVMKDFENALGYNDFIPESRQIPYLCQNFRK